MKVLESHKARQVDQTLEESLSEKSIVFSDKSTSYINIPVYVEVHITEKSSNQTTNTTLGWVHIAIANAKHLVKLVPRQRGLRSLKIIFL